MTPSRLLVPALLLCPAFLFAQENLQKTYPVDNQQLLASSSQTLIPAPQIDPLGLRKSGIPQNPLARLESSLPPQFETDQNKNAKTLLDLTPELGPGSVIYPEQLAGGATCYAIRSYVVARDRKNSDSVHPVSSSTCVSANKVQLKNATGSAPPSSLR